MKKPDASKKVLAKMEQDLKDQKAAQESLERIKQRLKQIDPKKVN